MQVHVGTCRYCTDLLWRRLGGSEQLVQTFIHAGIRPLGLLSSSSFQAFSTSRILFFLEKDLTAITPGISAFVWRKRRMIFSGLGYT
eukprot:scaffold70957_cov19-Tisochrysis_lutea.AAC.1